MSPGRKRIAVIGGGPSALMLCKNFVKSQLTDLEIEVFEKSAVLGAGMPYSHAGANPEHVANVSANEIPDFITSFKTWIKSVDSELLARYQVDKENFNEYKVLPRLLFGEYLSDQFQLVLEEAMASGLLIQAHLSTQVSDVKFQPELKKYQVQTEEGESLNFDVVIICTGHTWPTRYEGNVPGYFESPYPPVKLLRKFNHAICIRGSSLTAVDAVRTLARSTGRFVQEKNGKISYELSDENPSFEIVMYSIDGLLPALRFHFEESRVSTKNLLPDELIAGNMAENAGFLSLDFIFEKAYKSSLQERDPALFDEVKDLKLEEFVTAIMGYRESREPFELFREEYREAEESIRHRSSVHWKELLATLSYTMNYPAKYFSAEDTLRLQKVLSPLISVVIAFIPQDSAREMLALHDAGVLKIVAVSSEFNVEPVKSGGATVSLDQEKTHKIFYSTFVDCVGQRHLNVEDFPFKGLVSTKQLSAATISFKSDEMGDEQMQSNDKVVRKDGRYALKVPGIRINDAFQVVGDDGLANDNVFVMAVPYIGGYNPDYSGLDFCETAASIIVHRIADGEQGVVMQKAG